MPPPTEYPSKDVVQVLSAAREMITPPGSWLRNAYGETHRWCVIGAIMEAAGRHGMTGVIKHQMSAQCGRRIASSLKSMYGSGLYVTEWQDAPEREQKEVLRLMDRSIVDEQKILLEEDQREIEALQNQLTSLKAAIVGAYEEGWSDSSEMTGMTMQEAWRHSLAYSRANSAP